MVEPRPDRGDLLDRLLPLREGAAASALRLDFRAWLQQNLTGRFAPLIGRGGSWDEEMFDLNLEWEQALAAGGWACVTWPKEFGGRQANAAEFFAYRDEYFRAGAPERVNFLAEDLVGPTIIQHGTPEQRSRFIPKMLRAEELWCQGYSEPDAGSDLANIRTRARLEDGRWVIDGHKIWTSLAGKADWCFALCRTDPQSSRQQGISYLLIPMDQPGVTVRPIRQLTGSAEFAEVFFDGAVTAEENVVGGVGNGWDVAMSTLGFERDWFMCRYFRFDMDLVNVVERVRAAPEQSANLQTQLVDSLVGLAAFRAVGLQTLAALELGVPAGVLPSLTKVYASQWHRDLGELAYASLGRDGAIAHPPYSPEAELQRTFLYSRAETIFAGTNEIQKNILARRFLKMPKPGAKKGDADARN
ncbi:MAG: acyl-CoA dehydrogenase [Microbacteriaceae bacterium]|nr:acyl-CoA dehydrogenase [Microbacteriaceae bacterium]